MQREIAVGIINRTHALRGEVTLVPYLPDTTYYERIGEFYIRVEDSLKKVVLERVRNKGKFLVLKFSGFDTIEDVELFKGCLLVADRELIGSPPEEEYFYFDLIGLQVVTGDGESLGLVEDIMETGAGQIFVIDRNGKELLVPIASELVEDIDRDRGVVTLNLLDGMIDET